MSDTSVQRAKAILQMALRKAVEDAKFQGLHVKDIQEVFSVAGSVHRWDLR